MKLPRLVRVLNFGIVAWLTASTLAVVSSLLQLQLLSAILSGEAVSTQSARANHIRQLLIGSSQAVAFLVVLVGLCLWWSALIKEIGEKRSVEFRYAKKWAMAGFLVPFVNVFRPYQVACELWDSLSTGKDSPRSIIRYWWASCLLYAGLLIAWFLIMLRVSLLGKSLKPHDLMLAGRVFLFANVAAFISGVSTLWFVKLLDLRSAIMGASSEDSLKRSFIYALAASAALSLLLVAGQVISFKGQSERTYDEQSEKQQEEAQSDFFEPEVSEIHSPDSSSDASFQEVRVPEVGPVEVVDESVGIESDAKKDVENIPASIADQAPAPVKEILPSPVNTETVQEPLSITGKDQVREVLREALEKANVLEKQGNIEGSLSIYSDTSKTILEGIKKKGAWDPDLEMVQLLLERGKRSADASYTVSDRVSALRRSFVDILNRI